MASSRDILPFLIASSVILLSFCSFSACSLPDFVLLRPAHGSTATLVFSIETSVLFGSSAGLCCGCIRSIRPFYQMLSRSVSIGNLV